MSNKSEAKKIMKALEHASNIDLLRMLRDVAAKRPKAIINARDALFPKKVGELVSKFAADSLDEELIALIKDGKMIDAMKLCRERKNIMLHPARDYVYKLKDKLDGAGGK